MKPKITKYHGAQNAYFRVEYVLPAATLYTDAPQRRLEFCTAAQANFSVRNDLQTLSQSNERCLGIRKVFKCLPSTRRDV
jgi:hypothetical protein